MIFLRLLFFLLFTSTLSAQAIYKTPSGAKYHLGSCRMVENVSRKLVDSKQIDSYKLTPCKICKPPVKTLLVKSLNSKNKAVGTAASVRCKGRTQKGTRCKHKTRLANGYCYQHTKQNSNSPSYSPDTTTAAKCGAKTKTGKRCKRKVKGGGRCFQHD